LTPHQKELAVGVMLKSVSQRRENHRGQDGTLLVLRNTSFYSGLPPHAKPCGDEIKANAMFVVFNVIEKAPMVGTLITSSL